MKNDRKKLNRHIPWLVLMITVGVGLPKLLQFRYEPILQIVLSTLFIYLYTYIISSKSKSEVTKKDQYHPQNRMVESQKIMLELSNSMIQVKSFEELLNVILEKAIEMIPTASEGSVLVMNKEGKLEFKAIYGFEEALYEVKLDPEESYQWRATDGVFNGPIIIEDLQKYSNKSMSPSNYNAMNSIEALSMKSSLSAPIMINNTFFGSINIDSKMNNMFNEEDAQMMSYFANQATIAIVNHQLYDEMLYFSRYDGLTQIYNRRYFDQIIEEQLSEKYLESFAIVVIDLNGFKQINDKYGHSNGDRVLESFAQFFSREISENDVFARYGGDEFVSVFHDKNYTQTNKEMLRIQELSDSRSIELIDATTSIVCGFSYGIASYPSDGTNLNELLQIADARMYESKKSHYKRRRDDV